MLVSPAVPGWCPLLYPCQTPAVGQALGHSGEPHFHWYPQSHRLCLMVRKCGDWPLFSLRQHWIHFLNPRSASEEVPSVNSTDVTLLPTVNLAHHKWIPAILLVLANGVNRSKKPPLPFLGTLRLKSRACRQDWGGSFPFFSL